MTFESYNAIYGRVFNPWDITKYAGGSSGGEGAAIGARLSPAGVGSDIGGSIRIPAGIDWVIYLRKENKYVIIFVML